MGGIKTLADHFTVNNLQLTVNEKHGITSSSSNKRKRMVSLNLDMETVQAVGQWRCLGKELKLVNPTSTDDEDDSAESVMEN
ncbi:hypothetical protein GOBAR_AA09235 [Gossypium barbadense]|uniref:Uncharacterized protein n=1 Tax=Gossypium barbadense TaxID=3634 RepID=A0A2P5Y734_GOSBA|nr:hypothetical protein GOBAR_AA09235 [Gossypium barbadense]